MPCIDQSTEQAYCKGVANLSCRKEQDHQQKLNSVFKRLLRVQGISLSLSSVQCSLCFHKVIMKNKNRASLRLHGVFCRNILFLDYFSLTAYLHPSLIGCIVISGISIFLSFLLLSHHLIEDFAVASTAMVYTS